jgi:hypothetical protein
MYYHELILFEPIESITQLCEANDASPAADLARTFVISKGLRRDHVSIAFLVILILDLNPSQGTASLRPVGIHSRYAPPAIRS